jgi:hypothetical protein
MRILVVVLALAALAQSVSSVVRRPPTPPDHIGSILAAYESIAPLLPPDGLIRFVDTSPDVDFNTVNYYVAQQALAPRVVSRESHVESDFFITTTGSPADAGGAAPVAGLALVGTGASDVRVFRRERR